MVMVMVTPMLMIRRQPQQSLHPGRRDQFPFCVGEKPVAMDVAQSPGAPPAAGEGPQGPGQGGWPTGFWLAEGREVISSPLGLD